MASIVKNIQRFKIFASKIKFSISVEISEDNFLLSNENLRASPELWPEKVPGSDNFMKSAIKQAQENEQGLTQDDIRQIYRKLNLNRLNCAGS